MKPITNGPRTCAVCNRNLPRKELVSGAAVREAVSREIAGEHPEWSSESYICRADLNRFRGQYVHSLLESERGVLTSLEQEVVQSLREHELIAKNMDTVVTPGRTLGERLADGIAEFGGSWAFLISFFVFIVFWIAINSATYFWKPPDAFPFTLLNLMLSCLAAIQAPVIMMSQRRQEAKDRVRSQHDYQVDLKAELEIRHLHEKMDHLLSHQWERLVAIQEVQLELLAEISKKR